ncbi:MAG TPA: phosphoadenosine phosphosulfate reductase [Bacteroidales bacterium]|nr:phosphoadenosine phosphosulfate reductase [Bacteroidales bacterium]
MNRVKWDIETGGVLLTSKIEEDVLGISPRPVFYEELDLLKLNQLGWEYPHCEEPLMWACNKQYFYRGELMFEVKGANVYDPAIVVFQTGKEKAELQPVDVKKMLKKNKNAMFLLETEAIEFIRDTYLQYADAAQKVATIKANQVDFEALAERATKMQKRQMAIVKEDCDSFDIMPLEDAKNAGKRTYATTKIDKFLASFSGGKDSQVVLDLCTRAIPPQAFEVIYSDTGYELPPSLELYEQVKQHYQTLYPELSFRIARNHEQVLNYWDKIGTPSDTHRWCCSVMKTAPLYRLLKVDGTNKQAKVLAYEGVRAEESQRRANYIRVGRGKKHSGNVINAHPILYWNTTEVFIYLFEQNLPINKCYRIGKARVGCIICPFSSAWDDMISNRVYTKELKPFLDKLKDWSKKSGVKNIDEFIKERNWKIRACGNTDIINTIVTYKQTSPNFIAEVKNPKNKLTSWLPALGKFTIYKKGNTETGEFLYDKSYFCYKITYNEAKHTYVFQVDNVIPKLIGHLRKLVNKSAFCIQCEICEIDCPTGALSILPQIQINKSLCIHCLKCFDSHDNGCIVSDSARMITESIKKNEMAVHAYKSFGLRDEWLMEYFLNPSEFWKTNTLGTGQIEAFKIWLKDAELVDKKYEITPLGKLLKSIYEDNSYLVWEIIITQLYRNSYVLKWFTDNIQDNQEYNKRMLCNMILTTDAPAAKSTLEYAIGALIQFFKNTPLGEAFGYGIGENDKYIRKYYNDLSREAVAYSLYKYAEEQGIKSFRISDLYKDECKAGPYREFGISKSDLEKALRSLNSDTNRVLTAELNMGLDHITLRDDLNALSALEILTK